MVLATIRYLACILCITRAIANVIIANDGFCEMNLFRVEDSGKVRLGSLLPRRSAYFDGNLSVKFEISLRESTFTYEVPNRPPPATKQHRENPKMQDYWRYTVHGTGAECSKPKFKQPADIRMALVVLFVYLCVLISSMRWGSASCSKVELAGWLLIAALYLPYSVKVVHGLSFEYDRQRRALPGMRRDRFAGLHEGYRISSLFGGRAWDLKDNQIRDLVNVSPWLFGFVLISLFVRYVCNRKFSSQWSRALVTLLVAIPFQGILHEAKLLLTLGIVLLNFALTCALAMGGLRTLIPAVSWLFGLSSLMASADGFLTLKLIFKTIGGPAAARIGSTLDSFKGELGWHMVFNFVLFRMISWSCDFSRFLGEPKEGAEDIAHQDVDADLSEKARVESHRGSSEYRSLVLYLSYIFYPPLYLSGPIITFNAFASYMKQPQQECIGRGLCLYGLRWVLNTFVFVAFGHFFYTFAIMKNANLRILDADKSTVFEWLFAYGQDGETLFFYSYWTLKLLWMKFLVIWRFARLWALLDGVCPPENMNRCMSNNYTVRGFWRAWHRSLNRWVVRYMFVSLVGSRNPSMIRRLISILLVFMFVVFWHEPQMLHRNWAMVRVLAWGLLMAVFMAPEMILERVCHISWVQRVLVERPVLARHLTAMAGALCIQVLMMANLIGYAYGLGGMHTLLKTLSNLHMIVFLLAYTVWLSCGVQFMLLIRQRENCKLSAKNF